MTYLYENKSQPQDYFYVFFKVKLGRAIGGKQEGYTSYR
jgi:hypothetical protein